MPTRFYAKQAIGYARRWRHECAGSRAYCGRNRCSRLEGRISFSSEHSVATGEHEYPNTASSRHRGLRRRYLSADVAASVESRVDEGGLLATRCNLRSRAACSCACISHAPREPEGRRIPRVSERRRSLHRFPEPKTALAPYPDRPGLGLESIRGRSTLPASDLCHPRRFGDGDVGLKTAPRESPGVGAICSVAARGLNGIVGESGKGVHGLVSQTGHAGCPGGQSPVTC